MFERELTYFREHQEELVGRYSGKVLVLSGEDVKGAYDSPIEAYTAARKDAPDGGFMLQPCMPGPDAYTVRISTIGAIL